MKIAVLVDGAFLNKIIKKEPDPEKQAKRIVEFAQSCVEKDETLYRIFYYDCAPYDGKAFDLQRTQIDFSTTRQNAYQKSLLAHLARLPYVAVRLGMLQFGGWKVTTSTMWRLRRTGLTPGALTNADFQPDFNQKGVDMRIGLDTALLAMDRLVDRIALVTCDSDFIPAMKLARREGIQVVLVILTGGKARKELAHHADLYRTPPIPIRTPGPILGPPAPTPPVASPSMATAATTAAPTTTATPAVVSKPAPRRASRSRLPPSGSPPASP